MDCFYWRRDDSLEYKDDDFQGMTYFPFSTTFDIQNEKKIMIIYEKKNIPHKFKPEKRNYALWILLSNFRKAIRLQKQEIAIATAYQLVTQNETYELVQELLHSATEDVILHPEYSRLLWIVLATRKGFQLNQDQYQFVFGFICNLCQM